MNVLSSVLGADLIGSESKVALDFSWLPSLVWWSFEHDLGARWKDICICCIRVFVLVAEHR